MCEAVGHPVDTLTRVRIGPISDSRMKAGQFRDLRADEIKRLKRAVTDVGRTGSNDE